MSQVRWIGSRGARCAVPLDLLALHVTDANELRRLTRRHSEPFAKRNRTRQQERAFKYAQQDKVD